MALTSSVKEEEIQKSSNDAANEKPEKSVAEPARTRTSQRKAATAAVNAMKEQALGARKADDDDEGKAKRGGRGRPKSAPEKTTTKSNKKRPASSDGDDDDEEPEEAKPKKSKGKAPGPVRRRVVATVRKSCFNRAPNKLSVYQPEDEVKGPKTEESNSGEESASKTD